MTLKYKATWSIYFPCK